jgi:ribonucleoside-diphosphate reductase alpha chain
MTDKQQLLSDFKFYSSYSKFKKEDERMETWEEAIDRVMQMHYKKYQNKITPELQEYLDFATKQYKEKRILGSQRALQFGGDSILKHEMKQFNCLVSYCDRIEFFKEAMYLLLCGCGVGFSVQTLHVEKLPMIGKRIEGVKTFLIEDSIEGWADAIGVLLASYTLSDSKFQEYYGYRIDFDYTNN